MNEHRTESASNHEVALGKPHHVDASVRAALGIVGCFVVPVAILWAFEFTSRPREFWVSVRKDVGEVVLAGLVGVGARGRLSSKRRNITPFVTHIGVTPA